MSSKRGSESGRTAIVTGGGSGIGAALARALVANGDHVVVADIDLDAAQAVVDSLPGAGAGSAAGAHAARLDVTDAAAVAALVEEVIAERGGLDLMFANAGITWGGDTELLTLEQWNAIIDGFRGLAFRVIGGWARSPRAGLIAGIVATSVLFTVMHGSTDPYIITWYLTLWTCLAIITWRTGGLEVAIVLHAVLNTFSFIAAFYLRVDFGAAIQDRSAGVGTPYQLLPALVVIVITAVVWWWTRETGPALTPTATAGTAGPAVTHP